MRSLAQPPAQGSVVAQGLPAQTAAPLPPLCHVTIVAPRRKADLALPADIPLPHILPNLLRAMGEVGGESAAAPGWVLQRPGGVPLDIGQSLGALEVLDGEVLYLRPREAVLPPAMFDDVADVVATGFKDGPAKWGAGHTRVVGVSAATGLLVTGAVILLLAGPPWRVAAVFAGVFAVLLTVAGGVLSRAVGDSSAGALIGYAALPYGFLAGLLAPAGATGLGGLGSAHMLAAFATTGLVATVCALAVADGLPAFLGVAIASASGAVGAAAVLLTSASPAGVAAVVVAVLLACGPLFPMLAFRFAGLPMPTMPTNSEELRGDNQRIDGPSILERTRLAQRYATGFVAGVGLVALAAQLYLAFDAGWVATATALTLSLTLALRARVFQGTGQRLWLLVSALVGLAVLAISRTLTAGGGGAALTVAMGLLCVAVVPAGMGLWLPSGRPSPFWGRAADIVEVMLIVALFPLALGVLDVYSWVRGLAG
ncbi:type VII secretion integral membrane protein EccD [Streptosporangium carneum]|uniref:Type VII secretion integral membrane protein EccD n=1 Tax=Streptosporangium carneum TaxID=47481 RepID=A0A9W6I7L8_9ACTN|nr:type VII secretion integral membrane protein EccD [Streptosporangium carneum]GLK13592.1 type VII secretion integral membrane protein EccD [Streptosporangium carneum]